ncbi:MAG: Jag N-terminal domain-containing protein [Clostridia bacterium]|nr:Jag N-terminal domain-containing protein [Clostridia bacterium]
MLQAEGIGKNIEQAIENALFELKAPREDVDIKILNEGGLFKKAKVLVTISEDAKEKYAKRVEKRAEEKAIIVEEKPKQIEKCEKAPEITEDTAQQTEIKEVAQKEDVSMDAKEFLQGFLAVAGKENCTIDVIEDEKYITYSVQGDDLGDLIGHRGESFYALNRLLTAVAGKHSKRILLDIGGYREKRVESLASLARRTADRVAKSGRYSRLDPMNPSDRRIIHTTLQEDDRVTTLSKGTEPHRYVIVFPKEQD